MILLAEASTAMGDPYLQYGALGIVGSIAIWLMWYAGPKIVRAVENIAPTVAASTEKAIKQMADQLKAQEDRHADDRKETEARHREERTKLLETVSDSARATREALNERRG